MASQTYQLMMKSGPTPGKVYPLEKSVLDIGRDVANDVVVNDAEVSRRHARLTQQAGSYVLEDLGSTNGTFVDGKRLTGPHWLQPGETIMLGENVSLEFEAVRPEYDPDATMVGAPSQPAREPAETYIPPSPAYSPPPPPSIPEPVYSGRLPENQPEPYAPPLEDEADNRQRTWLLAGCGCLVILSCIVLVGALYYIDANFLWCDLFPFIPGC